MPPTLVGLVGTGVGPSLTPAMHMREARHHGLDYVYRTLDLDDARAGPGAGRGAAGLGPAAGVRRPQRDPPLQAAGAPPPRPPRGPRGTARRGQHRRLRRRRQRHRPQHRHHRLRHRAGLRPARRDHHRGGPARGGRRRSGGRRRAARRRHRPARARRRRPSTAATALAHELARRFPAARVDDRPPRQAARADCHEVDGLVHCTPTGMAAHPGLPLDAGAAAPRPVGGRHRLPPAGHRAAAGGARGRLPRRSTAATWRSTRPSTPSR